MSHVMRKPDFCICENKGADQLCGLSASLFSLHTDGGQKFSLLNDVAV